MTIKDIAKLSGVSVSTVSKIMNNKADSIAEQTKLKVLRIAREQRYTPYAAVKNGLNGRHYRLAVIAPLDRRNLPVIRRLEAAAHERGYQMILADSLAGGRPAAGQLAALRGASDGAIFVGEGAAPEPRGWPAVVIGSAASPTRPAVAADWGAAARAAAEHLESLGHRRLGLLSADDQAWPGSAVRASVERHYGERERPFDRKLSVTPATLPTLISAGATAVICVGQDLARLFYQYAWRQDLAIPQDVSVAALDDGDPEPFWPPLTVARLSADELARRALETLIAQIEGRAPDLPAAAAAPLLSPAESTAAPASRAGSAASILVVGSLNLDVMMSVPMMPSSGETVLIDDLSSLPGGKGANQAVAVARLGGEVSLIGRIGRDAGGKTVYNALRLHRVDTRGVSVDRQVETGRAYINVSPGGESFIEVYGGANRRLAPRHLERNEDLFRTASYCLIQSELPVEIFGLAVEFASRHGAKVIFKPCSLDQLPADLLKKIYLLVPNRKEAARLAGESLTLPEQAAFFLAQGAEEVIVTLDEAGCYHRSATTERRHSAYRESGLKPLDATGASDAFIGALAAALAEGRGLETAIRFANVAAGLSIAQRGAQSSLPDRDMMELRKKAWLPPLDDPQSRPDAERPRKPSAAPPPKAGRRGPAQPERSASRPTFRRH